MLEAASTPETSVNFYQTTRRNNPEDSHLHARRRENLKSYLVHMLLLLISWGNERQHGGCGKYFNGLMVTVTSL
jgi:hypothetical protein